MTENLLGVLSGYLQRRRQFLVPGGIKTISAHLELPYFTTNPFQLED